MTQSVSVSELRSNISQYLERVSQGNKIVIRDEKRNIPLAQITKAPVFNSGMYERVLRQTSGVLSKESRPEWEYKESVVDWLSKSRSSDERSF